MRSFISLSLFLMLGLTTYPAFATTDVTLSGNTLTIADVAGGNSLDQLDISFAGGTYTITDTAG